MNSQPALHLFHTISSWRCFLCSYFLSHSSAYSPEWVLNCRKILFPHSVGSRQVRLLKLCAMFLSFSLVYYYAPDIEERKWYWVTPGSAAGVAIWLLASIGFRVYLHFFNSYSATYGSLGAVIILMLWLYITGLAILIGGEVN